MESKFIHVGSNLSTVFPWLTWKILSQLAKKGFLGFDSETILFSEVNEGILN